ncbi:unnamed protein product [Closterium sp. Yama58-4]|nr:unnamed protein product [Closterium sp. Yama58-4]
MTTSKRLKVRKKLTGVDSPQTPRPLRTRYTELVTASFTIPASVATAVQPIVDAFLLQPATWQSALLVTSTIFGAGLPALLAGLTVPGILSAFLLGVTVWRAFYWPGFLIVCLYFILGTLVTKVKLKQKQQEGIAEKRSGRRGPWSVVGSAAAAVVCCLGAIAAAGGGGVAGMEGVVLPSVEVWQLGYVASFATKLSDTAGSEIGKAFGKRTFLVTSFQPVPRGTEGAVSLEGTLAGLVAAVVLSAVALLTSQVSIVGALFCVLASQIANFGESYVGATLQDKPGYEWMTNDIVNVINISIGALIAMALAQASAEGVAFKTLQSSFASLDADFFSALPRDLQVDLQDAAFDLTNGNVAAECGPAVSAALTALTAALTASEGAPAAAAAAVAGLKDAAAKLPPGGRERAVLGRRLRAAGRRFTGMGAYAQGKAAQLGKALTAAGEAVSVGCTDDGASDFNPVRTLTLGPLTVDVTSSKALTGAAVAVVFGVVSWALVSGLQAVDESSLAYANDNALALALVSLG